MNVWSTLLFTFISCDKQVLEYNSLRNRLALNALRAKPGANVVVSALLVRFPLCKLATVAFGDAKKELLSVLGSRNDKAITNCYSDIKEIFESLREADLTQVNKIYVNYTNDINPDFVTNSSLVYGVHVDKVGFNFPASAITFINRWIETATYKRIRDVINENDIDKNTTMVLVSAAHFKGNWEFPFDHSLTTNKKFHHLNRKITWTRMMSRIEEFLYMEDEANDVKMLTIRLGSAGTAITYVVPGSAQGLPAFLQALHKNPNLISTNIKKMRWTRLRIYLPRFKIKSLIDWTDFLKQIGLNKIFNNETSGLEGILKANSKSKHIYLSKAKQKIFLEMDEMGVVRHDVPPDQESMLRVMIGPGIGMQEFAVDRPFYFIISLSLGSVSHDLFNGVYYGPESN